MKRIIYYYLLVFFLFAACKKQEEWLDVKSNKSDVIPSTLEDFQALLDNYEVMNTNYPALGVIGADNSYVSDQSATTLGQNIEQNAYRWAPDIYEGNLISGDDWSSPYKCIGYANAVLDGLQKISSTGTVQYNTIKGSALFYRAFAYYHLAQLYMKTYDKNSANNDLGLPLKLNADVNNLPGRSSVQETYDQMIRDLSEAETLLPLIVAYKSRPSKIAAGAMLSKVYFSMENYTKALEFSNVVLQNFLLLDFNTVSKTNNYPFPMFPADNPEILFYAETSVYTFNQRNVLLVNEGLYQSYHANDLRRPIFYKTNTDGTRSFGGRYTGSSPLFCGLGYNEILMIRCESLARTGKISEAMNDLNLLLRSRYSKDENGVSSYTQQFATSADIALRLILDERRKELPFTGSLRWEDLRRLNKDSRFALTLTRIINGQQYSLAPNNPKYVYPIPPIELNKNPLTQNPR